MHDIKKWRTTQDKPVFEIDLQANWQLKTGHDICYHTKEHLPPNQMHDEQHYKLHQYGCHNAD